MVTEATENSIILLVKQLTYLCRWPSGI